jgi:hypothetical protein
MKAEPKAEHRWLQQLVGTWTIEADGADGQAPPPWTETVRQLGELWIVAEGEGLTPDGTPGKTMMTLGYDPDRGRFVGTWVGSMMTHMWVYDGRLEGDVLTLDCEGPDFEHPGATLKYQDIIELKPGGERTLRAQTQEPDGSWKPLMSSRYRRQE